MKSIFIILVLLILFYCSKKETTEPAPTTGTIAGTVMTKAGDAAVPAAIVTTEPPTSSVSTDNEGKYTIEEVDPGDYIVQAVKDGFDDGNVNVTVKAGKTVTADIRMGILLANHPPTKPQLLSPENHSEYQSIDLQLQWKEAADPDGDAVVYDLYFGKGNPPPLDMENLDSTQATKSNLDTATVYYWQVVAKDGKHATTASDIWQFKTTPNPIPTDGLIAYWPFNGNAKDESGNGNDGTVYGATLTTDRFGNENSAYDFKESNDHITINNKEVPRPFTVIAWIYKKENKSAQRFMVDSNYDLKVEQYNNTHKVGFTKRHVADYSFNYVLPLRSWKMVTWMFDKEAKLFIDGELIDTDSHLINCPMGQISASEPNALKCVIDDIRIYNRALSEKEIINIMKEVGNRDLVKTI